MNLSNHRLTIENIEAAIQLIDACFLNSPQYHCKHLSDHLELDLFAKIETLNPIRSFKGRGAEVLAAKAVKNQKIICASAGNFGQAMAYACVKRGIDITVYASTKASDLKVSMMRSLGAEVILAGDDFDEAKQIARSEAGRLDARFVEDSMDIETLEGTGTIGLELLDLPVSLDAVLVSLGNGALTSGIGRVFKAKQPHVKIIAIQSEGAPAMVESIKENKIINHGSVNTIADGIAVRVPVPQALKDLNQLVDDALLVSDDAIVKAMKLVHQHVGIVCEPSAAVGIAAIMENKNLLKGKKVATILCGGNLTEDQLRKWLFL